MAPESGGSYAQQRDSTREDEREGSHVITVAERRELPSFGERVAEAGLAPLTAEGLEVLQLNLGYLCNQTCGHCHLSCGPERREVMTRRTMEACLAAYERGGFHTADVTGGAPELNPHFGWLIDELARLRARTLVRTNLTVLVSAPRFRALAERMASLGVEVIASLPCYTEENTDRVRGDGTFRDSIRALRMLNGLGYGLTDDLPLTLVYHPEGAGLPPAAETLEPDYRRVLGERHGVRFTRLITMANLPVGRTAGELRSRGELGPYVRRLADAFNPGAAERVMCRTTLSVRWDGALYDCDFNQVLGLGVRCPGAATIESFDAEALAIRRVAVGPHCFGCTAGRGSSCGGALA